MRFRLHARRIVVACTSLTAAAVVGLAPQTGQAASLTDLRVSSSKWKETSTALNGASLSGSTYIFYRYQDVKSVTFVIDKGSSTQLTVVDSTPKFDLGQSASDGSALAFSTARLANGGHTLAATATYQNGTVSTQTARFTTNNVISSGSTGTKRVDADFNELPLGAVKPADFIKEVGPTNTNASAYEDVSVVDADGHGRVLRTKLEKNRIVTSGGTNGAQLFVKLPTTYQQACVSYQVRFDSSFDWSLGGKLPGLLGVAPGVSPGTPTGGGSTSAGWSARVMWLGPSAYSWAQTSQAKNMGVTYLYAPGREGHWGDNLRWNLSFLPGTWHSVRQCHTMNTVGKTDGDLKAWFDGRLVVDQKQIYRTRNDVGVNYLDFAVFRGGNTLSWAGSRDNFVDFDNVVVTTQ